MHCKQAEDCLLVVVVATTVEDCADNYIIDLCIAIIDY